MSLTLRPHISITEVNEGLVLLDERNGRYWHLNGTAGRMLRDLLDGHSPEQTAARLTSVSPNAGSEDPATCASPDAGRDTDTSETSFLEQVTADVQALIDGLHRAKLVNR